MKHINPKTILIMLLAFFVMSIVPIMIMAFYARPLWDDYSSTAFLKAFMDEHDNPLTYLVAVIYPIAYSVTMYFSWQGTYFAEVLFALQPGAWPVPAYWLTTFIIVGSVTFSFIFFWTTIADKLFNCDKNYGWIIALLMLILQFQKVPFIHQGFYWYNGAIYYSFFLALSLFEIALVIRMLFSQTDITKKKRNLLAFLAFLVSGGNYSNALVNCMILILTLIYARFFLEKDKFKAIRLIMAVALIGLLISMVAPGNSIRAAGENGMSAPRAIYHALRYALSTGKMWLGPWQFAILLIMIPAVGKMVKDSKVSFKYPILALVLMFGLYAAQMAPPFFGLSSPGAERQIDMYYYSFQLLMAGSLIYVEGWFIKRFPKLPEALEKATPFLVGAGVLLVVIGFVVRGLGNFNSVKIADDLISGRAEQYVREYKEITQKMASEDGICYVTDISQKTHSLDKLYIDEDPLNWVNTSMADYFGCEKVILLDATK